MSNSLNITNDGSFDADVINSSTPVVVDFWATWCAPCKAMVPHLQKIQDELDGKVKIVKLNVEENQATATRYKVLKLPTLLKFQGGELVDTMVGNPGPRKLRAFIEKGI
ncbi:Thioredoxin C-2 [Enhygromyxa salina]|uniref:Thioredoxin n=1 Tax=Enhygromyxa salina TaxID=215803 RepID=A0A2S9XAV2_9BACT|nr:thioredoxin [Enhygromyxa salina]PRP89978.1 Thioredoxin C-2 [Enhygromyxa salina]